MKVRVSFAVVVALFGPGCGSSAESQRGAPAPADERPPRVQPAPERAVVRLSIEPRMPADARTYVDRTDGLRFKLPVDWQRANDRATRRVSLVDGVLLAVGTSPIRPRRDAACSDAADEPRVAVGPTDALIVIEEDVRSRADLARKRPRFRLLKQIAPPGEPRRTRRAVFPAWRCRNEVGISGLA